MTRWPNRFPPRLMLRLVICGASVALSMTASVGRAQQTKLMKAEEVLNKWTEKTGGEAWKKLHNRVMNGTMEIPLLHLKGPITSYAASPGSKYEVWEPVPGQPSERGCSGAIAWETVPGSGTRILLGNAKATAILDAAFIIELRWRELFSKVETTGLKSVKTLPVGDQPGVKRLCYEVKMTPKDPDCEPEKWYIDNENFQRIGTVGRVMADAKLVDRTRLFADYRPVNDVLEPFVVCEQVDIQKRFVFYKSVQHNVRMSKYRFELPEAIKKQVADGGKSAVTSGPTTQPVEKADKSTSRAPKTDANLPSKKTGEH